MVKSYLCAFRQASYPLPNGSNIVFADMGIGIHGSLYTSSNSAEQAMIEKLPDFGGVIKVYRTYGEPDPIVQQINNPTTPLIVEEVLSNVLDYPEAVRVQDAISVVKSVCAERGIEYNVIRSKEAVLERAKYLSISFSNLN